MKLWRKQKMNSKGFLKDAAIMVVALGTMRVPVEYKEKSIRHDSNKHHKINNKIDRKIVALFDKVEEVTESINLSKEDLIWLKKFRDQILLKLVKGDFSQKPSYEYIGVFLLYLNFIDGRAKKLDPVFEFITDKIFDIPNMIEEIGFSDDGTEYLLAKSVIEEIRR
jgi:hypothetical protein